MEQLADVTARMADSEPNISFLKSVKGAPSLHEDPRMALLATCVVNQQRAGFRNTIDLRQAECPSCKAPGFNTGWGFFAFTCGAEILNDDDGTPSTPCPNEKAAA